MWTSCGQARFAASLLAVPAQQCESVDGLVPAARRLIHRHCYNAGTGVGSIVEELPAAEIIQRLLRTADAALSSVSRGDNVSGGAAAAGP